MEPTPAPDRVSDLYIRALACTPEHRSTFLDEECKGDAALRGELESLLRYEADSARFLETPAAVVVGDQADTADTSQMLGRQLGPYTIVAQLGSGGMGEVIARATPSSGATSRSRSCRRTSQPIQSFASASVPWSPRWVAETA
jgi:hypothetical protein